MIVGARIEEVELDRKAAEVALRPHGDGSRLSADEIKKLVTRLKGIVEILRHADPEDYRPVYRELNLTVVYHDDGRVQVTAGIRACTRSTATRHRRPCSPADTKGRGEPTSLRLPAPSTVGSPAVAVGIDRGERR